MSYNPKEVLRQEPAAIVTVLALINAAVLAFGAYDVTDSQLAACYAAALSFLQLFYVRAGTVSKDALSKLGNGSPQNIAYGTTIAAPGTFTITTPPTSTPPEQP